MKTVNLFINFPATVNTVQTSLDRVYKGVREIRLRAWTIEEGPHVPALRFTMTGVSFDIATDVANSTGFPLPQLAGGQGPAAQHHTGAVLNIPWRISNGDQTVSQRFECTLSRYDGVAVVHQGASIWLELLLEADPTSYDAIRADTMLRPEHMGGGRNEQKWPYFPRDGGAANFAALLGNSK